MAPWSTSSAPRRRPQRASVRRTFRASSVALGLLLVGVTPAQAEQEQPSEVPQTTVPAEAADGTDGTARTEATPPESTTVATDPMPNPDDPLSNEGPAEEAPAADVAVPPKDTYGDQGQYEPPEVLWSSVTAAEEKVSVHSAEKQDAIGEVHRLRKRLKELGVGKLDLDGETRATIDEIGAVSRRLQDRAIVSYQRLGSGSDPDAEASITDFRKIVDSQRRTKMVDSALTVDEADLDRLHELRADLDIDARGLVDRIRVVSQSLTDAESAVTAIDAELEQAEIEFHAFRAGSEIFIHGVVFPIAGEYSTPIIDSFGFPRMMGTADEHWHEGIDLFADRGTPLVATERGVIAKVGSGRLGGLKFWLIGESGSEWYYAHLDSFAPGLTNGQVVEAGELVGYVGNTGNAVGTPPHLHMQLHPDGGRPVNPYPLLKVVSDLELAAGVNGEGQVYDYEVHTAERDETPEVAEEPVAEQPPTAGLEPAPDRDSPPAPDAAAESAEQPAVAPDGADQPPTASTDAQAPPTAPSDPDVDSVVSDPGPPDPQPASDPGNGEPVDGGDGSHAPPENPNPPDSPGNGDGDQDPAAG